MPEPLILFFKSHIVRQDGEMLRAQKDKREAKKKDDERSEDDEERSESVRKID